MINIIHFIFRKNNAFGILLGLILIAGCTQNQEKEPDPVPVPETPEKLEVTCLLTKEESSNGNYVTLKYGADKKLQSIFTYIPATKYNPVLTSTDTVIRDNAGKIIRLQKSNPNTEGKSMASYEYDQNNKWIKTSMYNSSGELTTIISADYKSEGQVSKITYIHKYATGPDYIRVIEYEYLNGNVVKQIDYINNKPYVSTLEYDLTKENKYSEYSLLRVYNWETIPLSKNPLLKISTQTDVPGVFSYNDLTREYNAEGYEVKASSISSFQGKVSEPLTSTRSYSCN
ncbi:hypothetical protein AHMF7605_21585 [Adhaeribacter arboris]|uniref:DUF4595 domain-containing protein n=1 Tax=Adhaeribacter arboris TaxID=2072846 RepID=A0A2T2YK65_9BACT|nr:hypothetical protein [Adhaeribacter arboris]PSR55907.1 hypothetical protein AHMF7605_21585 [Adhaeribacter arboris]